MKKAHSTKLVMVQCRADKTKIYARHNTEREKQMSNKNNLTICCSFICCSFGVFVTKSVQMIGAVHP